jgi:NADPH:quinone reductase-like Zn-dependent oxidoreductase
MSTRAWEVERGAGVGSLRQTHRDDIAPGPGEVRIALRAATLNARDLWMPDSGTGRVVPVSDGAGVVEAIGEGVTQWRAGDRVIPLFYPEWHDGPPMPAFVARSLGGGIDGVLRDSMIASASGVIAIPDEVDDVSAAALPCAGLTAWNALFVAGGARTGDTVLLLGTGGVSILALQLAKAAGLRVILTSSDDAKLERARALGADTTINYRTHPEWQHEVQAMTDGGTDLALDIGGEHTLGRSIASVRPGGTVAMIGGVSGGFGARIEPFALAGGAKRLVGVLVGNRTMMGDLVAFVAKHRVRPVIDRTFDFDEARSAFAHLASGQHFGKVAIQGFDSGQ